MIVKCIRYITKGNLLLLKRRGRTLKTKIYKYMTSIPENVYINKLDHTVNEHNTNYRTIKMKSVDAKHNTYIDSTELHSTVTL